VNGLQHADLKSDAVREKLRDYGSAMAW